MHGYALEWLAEHLQPGRKVLDVGCGSGYLTACFASMVRGEGGEPYTLQLMPQLIRQNGRASNHVVVSSLA